jgi:hypothetical protein
MQCTDFESPDLYLRCLGIDFIWQFPNSEGYKYILVAIDYVSKWVEALPCWAADAMHS